jgi:hypothetical protein
VPLLPLFSLQSRNEALLGVIGDANGNGDGAETGLEARFLYNLYFYAGRGHGSGQRAGPLLGLRNGTG